MSKYCKRHGFVYIDFEETKQEREDRLDFVKETNDLYDKKNPPVDFFLHTENTAIKAAHEKLRHGPHLQMYQMVGLSEKEYE